MNSRPEGGDGIAIESKLIQAHTYAAFFGLLISALFGLTVSIKFHAPGFLTGHGWDTWGRLRYDHTQGILYAWLGNAFLAFLYYATPYLTRRPVTSPRLGWWLFAGWNFLAVFGGWTLVLMGVNQPLEWAEFPLAAAALIELGFAAMIVQFALPFLKCGLAELYVAGWYLLGGIAFTCLSYPVGNLLPHLLPGAMGAAFSGLWIHDAVGIFVTPFAVAIAYFVIPAVTNRPIYSHFYSMIGFWLLFLVYPLNGLHHYLYSSLPMGSQHVSEVASIYQGIDVILVVLNLLLSIPVAAESAALTDVPLRFIWTSVVLYLIVSVQGSAQAVMTLNSFVHFSDWVIGHSHLAMIGFASFAAMGGLAHIRQRMPGVRHSRRALAWSYWLMVTGLGLMVLDLTGAGLVQATLWQRHVPWMDAVRASRPYWVFRTVDGGALLSGFVLFALSFFTGPRNPGGELVLAAEESRIISPGEGRARYWVSTAYGATFGAGLVFFAVSFLALGVYPAIRLHAAMVRDTPRGAGIALTASELRGRKLYGNSGCAYCHTLQVRFTPADRWRFGPPTQAWETQGDYPQMWGTRRIGPDLARESGKHPADWQLVHLYNPRYVVPGSVMPGYPWLFAGDPSAPTQDAMDLAAYLDSLGRAAAQTSPAAQEEPAPPVPAVVEFPDTSPDQSRDEQSRDPDEGRRVFLANCSGCHGEGGDGRSPGAAALRPIPFDLTGFRFERGLVWEALEHGVPGSSMPAWNDLSLSELRAVADYVTAIGRGGSLPPALQVAPSAVLMEGGRRVYETHCVTCHGEAGDGDGQGVADSLPRPANFQRMQPSYPAAAEILRNGIPGSQMPAWPLLTPAEVQAVTYYVRNFYRHSPSGSPPGAGGATGAGRMESVR